MAYESFVEQSEYVIKNAQNLKIKIENYLKVHD